jgi:hypothetical protein
MTNSTRARYTLEFKEEAVRLVTGGERVATVARNLGLSEQMLHNWAAPSPRRGHRLACLLQSERMHSTLGYTSPMAFEENWRRQQKTLLA